MKALVSAPPVSKIKIHLNSFFIFRVFKAINLETGNEVALKKIKLDDESRREVAKEVLIHKLLRHQNIIKLIDSFEYFDSVYIVQELAVGGELFEQIEPDVGFPEKVAHFYFVQLIRSMVLQYMLRSLNNPYFRCTCTN